MRCRALSYILILFLVLFAGPLAWGFFPGAGGGVGGFIQSSGCGGFNLSGNLGGDEDEDTSSFESGMPVDIPVSVAKAIPTVDPRSMVLVPGEPIGTITFTLSDDSCRTVGKVHDGEFIASLEPDSSCTFEDPVLESLVGEPVAYVVLCDDCTTETAESGGYPVIAEVKAPAGLVTDYTLTVYVTNVGADADDATLAATVRNSDMAYLGNNTIVWSALNVDGDPSLWTSTDTGGFPTQLAALATPPLKIESGADSVLALLSSPVDLIEVALTGGTITDPGEGTISPTNLTFQWHPSERYVFFPQDGITNPFTGNATQAAAILDIETGTTTTLVPDNQPDLVTINCDFSGNSELVCITLDETGLSSIEIGDFSEVVADADETFDPEIVLTTTEFRGKPEADFGANGRVFYECGATDLCLYDRDTDTEETVVDVGCEISNHSLSNDRISYLLFEADCEGTTSVRNHNLGIYDVATGSIKF